MNFGLEQVDQVIARTGVSYQRAKEALIYSEGDVLDAIIYLEVNGETFSSEKSEAEDWDNVKEKVKFGEAAASQLGSMGEDISNFFKDIIKQGNINRIAIKKDGRIILDLPIAAGAVGAVFFAPATIISIIAAFATGCELEIIKEDGEVVNVKDVTKETLEQVKSKVNVKKSTDKAEEESEVETEQEATDFSDLDAAESADYEEINFDAEPENEKTEQ